MALPDIVNLVGSTIGALCAAPRHPYTEALLAAVPVRPGGRRERAVLLGDASSPVDPPPGWAFHTRCPIAKDICRGQTPILRQIGADQRLACHLRGGTRDERKVL